MVVYTFPIEKHLVVFRPRDRHLFILNPTARWIWDAWARDARSDEIASEMSAHFNIPTDTVLKDIQQTLSQWSVEGLEPGQSAQSIVADPPCETAAPNVRVSLHGQVCFQGCYLFGATEVVVRLYTSDLKPLFEPLLSGLKSKDREMNRDNQNVVEVIKDKDQYVVAHNRTEVGRTPLQHHALGRIIQILIQKGYRKGHCR